MCIGMWPIKTQSKPHANHCKRDTCRKVNRFARSLLTGYLGFLQTRKALELTPEVFLRAPLIEEYLDFLRVRSFLIFFFPIAIVRFSEKFPAPLRAYDQRPRSNRSAAAAYECFGRHLDPLSKSR